MCNGCVYMYIYIYIYIYIYVCFPIVSLGHGAQLQEPHGHQGPCDTAPPQGVGGVHRPLLLLACLLV